MSSPTIGRFAPPVVFLGLLTAIWQAVVTFGLVNTIILPEPVAVVTALGTLVADGILWEHLGATTFETLVGYGLGVTLGITLAVLSSLFITLRRAFMPYVISLQVTPLIAVAPLIVAWLGFGYSSKIAVSALICFFPVFVNTLAGVLATTDDEREMFRSLGASRLLTFRRLMLPRSLPLVFAGLKTSMTLALIGAVVGEFIAGQRGLGLLVKRFSAQLAVPEAFAVVLTLTLLGLTLYGAINRFERTVVFWAYDNRLLTRTRRRQQRQNRETPAMT